MVDILVCIKHLSFLSLLLPLPFSALRPTFSQVDYEGNEGPDRGSNLAASPCNVLVRLEGTIIEEDLTIRLIPRTFEENAAVNGPPPTAGRLGSNASSKNIPQSIPSLVLKSSCLRKKVKPCPLLVHALAFHENQRIHKPPSVTLTLKIHWYPSISVSH